MRFEGMKTGEVHDVDSFPAVLKEAKLWTLAASTAIGFAAGVAIALSWPVTYRAECVVMVEETDPSASLTGSLSSLTNLAALAGLSSVGGGSRDRAVELLRSKRLVGIFIEKRDLLPALFPDRRSKDGRSWLPGKEPSLGRGIERFSRSFLSIVEDKRSGAIRVAVMNRDRAIAAEWANSFVKTADDLARETSQVEIDRGINFLNRELGKTNVVGVQQGIHRLIEAEIGKSMLTNVHEYFLYRIIDPAIAPEADAYARPNRPLIVLFFSVIAFSTRLGWVAARNEWERAR